MITYQLRADSNSPVSDTSLQCQRYCPRIYHERVIRNGYVKFVNDIKRVYVFISPLPVNLNGTFDLQSVCLSVCQSGKLAFRSYFYYAWI